MWLVVFLNVIYFVVCINKMLFVDFFGYEIINSVIIISCEVI